MSTSITERLLGGTVLGAGGYVFELERRGYIKAGPFVAEVVLDFPDALRELHPQFLRAGADVMVALTYYAHREKLRNVGRPGDPPDGPVALDPCACSRFEMAKFALQARELGVDYVGICCGAGPHHVRAMAEALGRKVPASKYSPSMDLRPMFLTDVSAKDAAFLPSWTG